MTDLTGLTAATAVADADLLLLRQGTLDKRLPASLYKAYVGAGAVSGMPTVATIADARAQSSLNSLSAILVQGYWSKGDGGGGIFYFDGSDITTLEDYAINIVTATTVTGGFGRLKRMTDGCAVNIRWFGAVWNNTSHPLSGYFATLADARVVYPEAMALSDEIDGVALQRAINWVMYNANAKSDSQTPKFSRVELPAGRGLVTHSIVAGYGAPGPSGNYSQITIRGQGARYTSGGSQISGTSIWFQNYDGFGFGLQGALHSRVEGILIEGRYNYLAGHSINAVNGYYYINKWQDPAWPTVVGGTAQGGGASTITLAAGTTQATNYFNGMQIYISSGTGAGQLRTISAYNSTTKVATVSVPWDTAPDNTSVYITVLDGFFLNTAVCVDPFTTVGAFPVGYSWPSFRLPPELWGSAYDSTPTGNAAAAHTFTYGDGTGLYNSDGCHLYNVSLNNWYVGFGRIGGDSNSEFNTWEGQDSQSTYVVKPMMNTGSQSRQPVANGVKFQFFHTAISGRGGLNPNDGNIQCTFKDCHFGFGINVVDDLSGWAGPVKFDGCYAESLVRIGTGQVVTLANTYLSLQEQDVQYGVPDYHMIGDLIVDEGSLLVVKNGLFVQGNVYCASGTVRAATHGTSGVAQAGSTTSITLAAGTPQGDNFYNGYEVFIQMGQGKGQRSTITAYNSATKVATVSPAFSTAPNNTSVYMTGPDVAGIALALAFIPRGGIFATGNVEIWSGNMTDQAPVSGDHSTFIANSPSWIVSNIPPAETDEHTPHYWVHPYQATSASARYRRTFEQRFVGAQNAAAPLIFENAPVPSITTIATSVAVRARNNRDLTCDRYNTGNGVKADIGDVFALAGPDMLTYFIVIMIDTVADQMVIRQINNYYENWYASDSSKFYAPVQGSPIAEIYAVASWANSQFTCSRVYDFSMYGYVGSINNSGQSITNLKNGQLGTNTFNYPDRTFPVIAGDTLIITDNSDAWQNVGGAGYAKYWPVVSVTQSTATMVLGSGTLPATGTVVRPKFAIRNFNA